MELPKEFTTAIAERYTIEGELGEGLLATAFLASDLRHSRRVVIKVLRRDAELSLSDVRFVREIKFVSQMQHPRIVPLYDSGRAAGQLYYVMPYLPGETLRARLRRTPRLPLAEAVRITSQIAEALDYAHRHGVVHRDVRPENLLLHDADAMLTDFGIAKAVGLTAGQQLTTPFAASPGVPAYMSPEQLLPGHEVDGRSDTYSLAVVLREMLSGVSPTGTAAASDADQPVLSAVRPDLPRALDDVMARALAQRPADRYPTACEFANALANAAAGALSEPAAAAGAGRSAPRSDAPLTETGRGGSLRLLLAAAIAVAIVIAALLLLRRLG